MADPVIPREHFARPLTIPAPPVLPLEIGAQPTPGKGLALRNDGLVEALALGSGSPDATKVLLGNKTWSLLSAGSLTGMFSYTTQTVSAANTDLGWAGGSALSALYSVNVTGGTLRNVAAPTSGEGTRLVVRCSNTSGITIKHNTAGGGVPFYTPSQTDIVMANGDVVEFLYVASFWFEISRDLAKSANLTGQITGTTGAIVAGTGFTAARNSAGNYTITFTTAFAAAPVVMAVVLANQPVVVDLISTAVGSFVVEFRTAAGVAQDQNFQFLVTPMV